MAQNVFHSDAWTRAKNRFIEDLTVEEQVCSCRRGSFLLGYELKRSDLFCEESPVSASHLISHLGSLWIGIRKAHSASFSVSFGLQNMLFYRMSGHKGLRMLVLLTGNPLLPKARLIQASA